VHQCSENIGVHPCQIRTPFLAVLLLLLLLALRVLALLVLVSVCFFGVAHLLALPTLYS
jgi:hypothetical protein